MGMEFDFVFWALMALSLGAAAAYGTVFLDRPKTLLRAGVKTLFMGAMTTAFVTAGAPFPLVLALAASAFGDLFLALENKNGTLSLGILSFLIAQLLYFLIFFGIWFFSGDNSPLWPRYAAIALVVATSIGFLIWMGPKLGWMAIGVVPYAIAITGMACMAMWMPWAGWPAMIGAASFLVSDFVLSAELFRLSADAPARRITAPMVWWTYVAAQVLIVLGVVLAVFAS